MPETKVVGFPKEVKINDIIYKIPQSWKDINIRQYLKLLQYKKHDDIELISIMLDTTRDVIFNSSIEDLDLIVYSQLEWYVVGSVTLDEYLSKEFPKTVKIGDVVIDIPKDLTLKSFGQKISAEQLLASSQDKNPLLSLADILAIYFYPEYTKKDFDYDEAILFRDEFVMQIAITDGYPIGGFFLKRLRESLNRKTIIFLANMPKTRRQQILSDSKSSSNLKQ